MKAALHNPAALVSPEELQGLLGPASAPGSTAGREPPALPWMAALVLLGLLKFSLLLALARLPLLAQALQDALGTYVGLRLGLELAVLGLLTLTQTGARLQRWRPVLLTMTLTTFALDLLVWLSLGL
jgi:hypothetical protein